MVMQLGAFDHLSGVMVMVSFCKFVSLVDNILRILFDNSWPNTLCSWFRIRLGLGLGSYS